MKNTDFNNFHQPVMVEEVTALMNYQSGIYVDATLGGGGHAEVALRLIGEGRLIGIDQDREAIEQGLERFRNFGDKLVLVNDNFENLPVILAKLNISAVDGILYDLGVSRHQLKKSQRGFSFQQDGPLDMRMNQNKSSLTAFDIVNKFSQDDLARIFKTYGEEKKSRQISSAILRAREKKPLCSTLELAELVTKAAGRTKKRKAHPATCIFQALRIAVNRELEVLESLLGAVKLLKKGGRIVVISYHSLEDRIVKRTFKRLSSCQCPALLPQCQCKRELKLLTAKPITPQEKEVEKNPSSRSAKLRAVEKF